jgi:RHS repeat-associated protein
MQGAGGVGGLVATVIQNGPAAGVYFPVYDGNGNVMGYVRASDGVMVAQYEYGPFGELLRATGPLAQTFNHLFSTKYFDWETGLSYYGHRYYSPTAGRWLSRDPLGEHAFFLQHVARKPAGKFYRLVQEALKPCYSFVGNAPLGRYDLLGLDGGIRGCISSAWSAIQDWYQTCKDYGAGWVDGSGMFWDWVTGGGEADREFGPHDCFTRLMQTDGCVQEAIAFWQQKNKNKSCCDRLYPVSNFRCKFGLSGFIGAGINPAQHFIGSYRVDITPDYSSATINIKLTNTTSMTSFLYGMAPDWERDSFRFCGNMRQTYSWDVPCYDLLGQ